MVLDRGLAAAGDEDQLLDPGVARLVDRILDERLVDDRQHFLRHRLGGRQEPGPEATDGEDRLTHGYGHGVLSRRPPDRRNAPGYRSEEHTSELQSLKRISYAVFCLHKKK